MSLAGPVLAKDTVVIYTAIENEQITEYKKAYEKALPNLEVKMLRFSTGDISARFMAEKDNMQADVIWGVAATSMLIFKQAGLLEPYTPKGLERFEPLFRDKASPPSWVGNDIWMSAFCINTEVAKKKNLPMPASWADLTKPVYKGHVVMPNPHSSGTGYLSVASILQRLGEAELIHPSRDCRDWRRWLQRTGRADQIAWQQGKLFDTLELGISAAAQGHGVSIGDLALVGAELQRGSLVLPFHQAVKSGDSYYLVWPGGGDESATLMRMRDYLLEHLPDVTSQGVELLD